MNSDFLIQEDLHHRTTLVEYKGKGGIVTVPDGVEVIKEGVFFGDENCREIYLPDSVEEIGEAAFFRSRITKINLPDSLREIKEAAFSASRSLRELVIPSKISEIQANTFNACTALQSVVFSQGLRVIGNFAFKNCNSLTSVEIPEGVERIGTGAFQNCSRLRQVSLPSTLRVIDELAFSDCRSLEVLKVPDSVESFSVSNLRGCSSMRSLECENVIFYPEKFAKKDDEALVSNLYALTIMLSDFDKYSQRKKNYIAQGLKLYEQDVIRALVDTKNYAAFGTYLQLNLLSMETAEKTLAVLEDIQLRSMLMDYMSSIRADELEL